MRKTVLLIDDDPFCREMLKDMLEALGCNVTEARDGDAGVALFSETRRDLTITDISLGGTRSGFDVISELRQRDESAPIVAVTGGGSIGSKTYFEAALERGATSVLQKPIRFEDLETVLRK